MDIPAEMQRQCEERVKLIASMQEIGAIPTPISYLKTPVLIVMHMDDQALSTSLKDLMKTRKKGIPYQLNGRIFWLRRKEAIAIVKEEMRSRQ